MQKGDIINHHGESKVVECKIIDMETTPHYWNDRGIIRKSYDITTYTLRETETGREFDTVESGRFRKVS